MHAYRLLCCILASTVIVTLAGCGGGGGTDGASNWIVGQWTLDSVSHSIDGTRMSPELFEASLDVTVNADRTWTGIGSAPVVNMDGGSGTWTYLGDGRWLFTAEDHSMPVTRLGNELYMSGEHEGMQGYLWFSRTSGG